MPPDSHSCEVTAALIQRLERSVADGFAHGSQKMDKLSAKLDRVVERSAEHEAAIRVLKWSVGLIGVVAGILFTAFIRRIL